MKVENRMRFGKEICNLQRRKNKRQSNGVMFEMMASKIIIDLNVLSLFMKNRVMSNLNKTLVVTIHKSEMRKENSHICK
jgi:archaellum biogenesis ATPase FlaH